MDLLEIKPRHLSVDLIHPGTGKKLGVTIVVASAFSDEVQREHFRLRDEAVRTNFFELTAAERDKQSVRALAAQVVGWAWGDGEDGTPATLAGDGNPPLTEENKLRLLSVPHLRVQVEGKIRSEADFFVGPETV